MREQEWDVIPSQPHPAHVHMALDEVLLESVRAGRRRPTLRLWEWIESALVIGSHQSVMNEVDAVAARELGFVVTRRMSGGGTMLCEPARTITFSLYLPAASYPDDPDDVRFVNALSKRIWSLPGVKNADEVRVLPLTGSRQPGSR